MGKEDVVIHTPSIRLILCRLLVIAGFVTVIVIGAGIRIWLPPPEFIDVPYNSSNLTAEAYYNMTMHEYHGFAH